MTEKTILLLDMNAYFASVEQAANPALRGKPIVVCGTGRTVVTTASYEARKFGVRTGMNLYEARQHCPQLIPVIGNLRKYADTSKRIHKILLEFTDLVEIYSIDECFMDVSHKVKNGQSAENIAKEIKREIKETLNLTCSIGIGPNKVVAKTAAKLMKPDGLVIITKKDIPAKYSKLPIESFQGVGVGRKTSAKLKLLGIATAKELGDAPISMLTSHFGVLGYYLKQVGLGMDDSEVKGYYEEDEVKSVGHSYTLEKDTWDTIKAKSYLRMLSEKVGNRLRAKNLMGKTISLTVRYSDFKTISKHHNLGHFIVSGYDIYFNAAKIFDGLLPLKKAVRLLGVSISELEEDTEQGFLFEDMEKKRKAVNVVDEINKKYGEFTMKPTSILSIKD